MFQVLCSQDKPTKAHLHSYLCKTAYMERLSALLSVLSDEGTFNHLDLKWQLLLFFGFLQVPQIYTVPSLDTCEETYNLHCHSVAHLASFSFD